MERIILTKETAREWAIKKWESIIAHNGKYYKGIDAVPELEQFISSCAYCTFYGFNNRTKEEIGLDSIKCKNCPINLEEDEDNILSGETYCTKENHPFMLYADNSPMGDIEGAKAVLELIKNSPDKI